MVRPVLQDAEAIRQKIPQIEFWLREQNPFNVFERFRSFQPWRKMPDVLQAMVERRRDATFLAEEQNVVSIHAVA